MTRREGPTQGGWGAKRQERGDRQSERARRSLQFQAQFRFQFVSPQLIARVCLENLLEVKTLYVPNTWLNRFKLEINLISQLLGALSVVSL